MKNLFSKIKNILAKAFDSVLDFLLNNADVAIKVTNTVKEVINNPIIGLAVALTPNKKDDAILARAKLIAPDVVIKFGLALKMISIADAESDRLIAASKIMEFISNELPEEGKAIFLRELSGKIGEALSDGDISGSEIYGIIQLRYKKLI